jgi:hypothetical protein
MSIVRPEHVHCKHRASHLDRSAQRVVERSPHWPLPLLLLLPLQLQLPFFLPLPLLLLLQLPLPFFLSFPQGICFCVCPSPAGGHLLQRPLRCPLRLRHRIESQAFLVVRFRFIQLAQPSCSLRQSQLCIGIVSGNRHRIARALIRTFEIAITLIERRNLQVLRLSLVRSLMERDPPLLLEPFRSARLCCLRGRIVIGISQRPCRTVIVTRAAAGTTPRAPGIFHRPTTRISRLSSTFRRVLPRKREFICRRRSGSSCGS